MRFTKSFLRAQKIKIEDKIKAVCHADHEQLVAMMKAQLPGCDIYGADDNDLRQTLLMWGVEEALPQSQLW